jgi:putative ATP-binding cassette transporter
LKFVLLLLLSNSALCVVGSAIAAGANMNLLWFLLRASWQTMSLAAIAGAISGLCSVGLIALINTAISSNSAKLGWIFVIVAVVALISGFGSRILLVHLSQTAIYQMRLRLSSWILASPLRHLEELGANRLLAAIVDDTDAISSAVFNIPFLCIDFALLAGCLLYLCWLFWMAFLFVVLFLVITILTVQLFLSRDQRLLKVAREQQDQLFKHFRAMTDGIKELKLNHVRRKVFLDDELQVTAAQVRDQKIAGLRIFSIASSMGELLFFLILGLLVFSLPRFTVTPTPVLSGYVLTITYLLRPLQSILEILPALAQGNVALQKIEVLGLSLASRAESSSIATSPLDFQKIALRQVMHSYEQEGEKSFAVGPIDLTIHSGELIFIVGGNGSGKSTLAKLITGLYIPDAGEIYLDDQLVTDRNRENYRQLFAAIFADFYLFERLLGIDWIKLDR